MLLLVCTETLTGILVSDELYMVPGMQKDKAVQERKPSSISTDSGREKMLTDNIDTTNWSCNAGDSGIAPKDGAGVKPNVQEVNYSSSARGDTLPQKEPCPAPQDCDFEFKFLRPTGLYI